MAAADSTLTIKIVQQNQGAQGGGNAIANGAQGGSHASANGVQTAPRASTGRGEPRGEKSLASLALGMMVNQGFQSLTSALGTLPGQGNNARRLSNIGGGAIQGAAAGAMLGPAGMAVGAVIGTATGALKTFAEEAKATRDALRALKDSAKMQGLTTGARRQDAAFVRTLQWMTPEQRSKAISDRGAEIKNGDGNLSVRNLTNDLRQMIKAKRTDTPEYKEKEKLLAMQTQRLATLGEMDDKNAFQNLPSLLKGNDHADALQKIGAVIGPTINVKDTNREMLDFLRQICETTRTIAAHDPASTKGQIAASGSAIFLP